MKKYNTTVVVKCCHLLVTPSRSEPNCPKNEKSIRNMDKPEVPLLLESWPDKNKQLELFIPTCCRVFDCYWHSGSWRAWKRNTSIDPAEARSRRPAARCLIRAGLRDLSWQSQNGGTKMHFKMKHMALKTPKKQTVQVWMDGDNATKLLRLNLSCLLYDFHLLDHTYVCFLHRCTNSTVG